MPGPTQAYRDGAQALRHGFNETANPHPPGSPDYEDWLEGYDDQAAQWWSDYINCRPPPPRNETRND